MLRFFKEKSTMKRSIKSRRKIESRRMRVKRLQNRIRNRRRQEGTALILKEEKEYNKWKINYEKQFKRDTFITLSILALVLCFVGFVIYHYSTTEKKRIHLIFENREKIEEKTTTP
jgi:hypothetical protein